jgi:hypothetical protein
VPTAQTYTLRKLGEALDYYWTHTKRKVRVGVVAGVSTIACTSAREALPLILRPPSPCAVPTTSPLGWDVAQSTPSSRRGLRKRSS